MSPRPAPTIPEPHWLIAGLQRADGIRIHTLPRPKRQGTPDEFAAYRVATLAGHYHRGGNGRPVVWLADRAEPGGRVELVASGVHAVPSEAETSPVKERGVWKRLARHASWAPVLAQATPLYADSSGHLTETLLPVGAEPDASSEEGGIVETRWGLERALARFSAPCSVLVTAEPVAGAVVEECVKALDQRAVMAGGPQAHHPRAEEAFRHWSGRVWECRRGLAQGAWMLRLVTGADDETIASELAGRVAAAFGPEVGPLGYLLSPAESVGGFDEAMWAAMPGAYATDYEWHWDLPDPAAGIVSSGLVAALIRPPRVEVSGVRLVAPPTFDIVAEHLHAGAAGSLSDGRVMEQDVLDEEPIGVSGEYAGDAPGDDGREDEGTLPELSIRLGTVLDRDRRSTEPFPLSGASLNRHLFVPGATGSGKTTTVRSLLGAAARLIRSDRLDPDAATAGPVRRLPWMVVEPEKAEYAHALAGELARLGEQLVVIRPGDLAVMRAGIDPLRPAPGFPLQTHIDLVRALFLAAFDAQEPFPQVLSLALTRCYEEQGWDLATGQPHQPTIEPRYPTLADLQRTAETVIGEVGYGREVADNVLGFVRVRLSSLRLGTTGQFLENVHQIDYAELLRRFVIVELEDIGDDHHKAFLMGAVLIGLVEHLRVQAKTDRSWSNAGLRHLTVFEEAHRLLRRAEGSGGASGHAVRMITGLLAEIRAYGEGLVIADQIPGQLDPAVIKNTAVKIMHRLPAKDDRDAVGATMNLTAEQSSYVVTLPPGQAAAFADGMDQPVLIGVPPPKRRTTDGGRSAGAGPDAIVETACGRCRMDYGLHGRSAGTIVAAERLREAETGIAVWCELSVIACLTYHRIPQPSRRLLERLSAFDPSVADAALALTVDAAVADRSSQIWQRSSPGTLASYVVDQLRRMRDGRPFDTTSETSLQRDLAQLGRVANVYRWQAVARLLQASRLIRPDGLRHSNSRLLEEFVGEEIPGDSLEEQFRHANVQEASQVGRRRKVEVALFGKGKSVLDRVVPDSGDVPDHEWHDRLRAVAERWLDVEPQNGVLRAIITHTQEET